MSRMRVRSALSIANFAGVSVSVGGFELVYFSYTDGQAISRKRSRMIQVFRLTTSGGCNEKTIFSRRNTSPQVRSSGLSLDFVITAFARGSEASRVTYTAIRWSK